MAAFDIYVFVLCLIVFVALTAMFIFLISYMIKMRLKIIKGGLVDDEIIKEQQVSTAKHKNLAVHFIINKLLPICFTFILVVVFGLSLCVKFSSNTAVDFPVAKVVKSNSMAYTYEKNKYIEENNLNHQFQKFDLIIIDPLPKEEQLKLYDIVVYESNGYLIIHRIVGIEEPNEEHKERHFLLQGDANQYPDTYPVRYSQMKGIYKGKRIRYIGSFIDFMNSPAGYLCILLVVFVYIISPFIDKKLLVASNERLNLISFEKENYDISFIEGNFSKNLLADYVHKRLDNKVIIKKSRIRKSAPDTYYALIDNKKKCFAYVYSYKTGKVLIRVIGDNKMSKDFPLLQPTNFPKSKKYQWYAVEINKINEEKSKLIWKLILASYAKITSKEKNEVLQ